MFTLDADITSRMIREARAAIVADLIGELPRGDDGPWPPLPRSGVFVTLRREGRLRGCVGTFAPSGDLPETLRKTAISAAHDPRFVDTPISAMEISELRIEISLLSPLERIENPLDFELGRHGIYVRRGEASGCFLPDVATDRGWDKETFLGRCCEQKAGLAVDAWRHAETEVLRFTVVKFGE